MKKILIVFFLGSLTLKTQAQDLVSGGSNSWVFHTPDDGRTTLYIAPKINGNWAFGNQTIFNNNGTVGFSGKVTGPSFKVDTNLEIPDIHGSTYFKDGISDGGSFSGYNTLLSLHWGLGIGSRFTSNGNGGYEEKAMIMLNGRNGNINSQGTISSPNISTTSKFYKSSSSPGSQDPILLSAFSEHSTNGGELPIITLGYRQGIISGTDMDTKIWSYARNLNESRNFITIGRNRIDLSAQKIYTEGVVGIGTSDVGSHELAVEGSIGAREIKVEASGWSDFVFKNDYDLRTLEEVEQHIYEKGHLPEIPNEAEVTENGINLGEMDAKLLQKIEELTLYLIEQNKEIKELKEKVLSLENN